MVFYSIFKKECIQQMTNIFKLILLLRAYSLLNIVLFSQLFRNKENPLVKEIDFSLHSGFIGFILLKE